VLHDFYEALLARVRVLLRMPKNFIILALLIRIPQSVNKSLEEAMACLHAAFHFIIGLEDRQRQLPI